MRTLRCTGCDVDNSMFSIDKEYVQLDDGTVIDNLGHKRFIGSHLSFIVRNDCNIFRSILMLVYHAHFEVV